MPVKDKGCKLLQPCLHIKLFLFQFSRDLLALPALLALLDLVALL